MRIKPQRKRNARYYFTIFLSVCIGVAIYGLIVNRQSLDQYWLWIESYFYFPFLLVLVLISFDWLTRSTREQNAVRKDQGNFILEMSEAVKEELAFNAEDFGKLRANEKFQDALFEAYEILKNGESETYNYQRLTDRFSSDSKTYQAIELIITKIKNYHIE